MKQLEIDVIITFGRLRFAMYLLLTYSLTFVSNILLIVFHITGQYWFAYLHSINLYRWICLSNTG